MKLIRSLILVPLAVTALAALTPAPESPPNIVVFFADDLGYGDVGYQGGKSKAPTLDAWAKKAVRFTDFYAGAPNCSPSRSCLLTGRSATRVGMYNWRPKRNPMVLRGSKVTIAELLRDAGYRTAVFGKWHQGEIEPRTGVLTPSDHGFEYSFVTDHNAYPSHHNPNSFVRNGVPVPKTEGYACQLLVDEALGQGRSRDLHRESEWPGRKGVMMGDPFLAAVTATPHRSG